MRISKKYIAFIVWLSKSPDIMHDDCSYSVTHKGFIATSPGSDYIEIEKEAAYSRSMDKSPGNVFPTTGDCIRSIQVSKIGINGSANPSLWV